jgi:hypothetical protein
MSISRNGAGLTRLRSATRGRWLVPVLFVLVGACSSSPSGPSAGGSSVAGQWSGTTSQGLPITFAAGSDEYVTAISIGYSFNSCSGSQAFSALRIQTAPDVTCIGGPCPSSITSYRSLAFSSGTLDGPLTTINGLFLGGGRAEGSASFFNYPGCGTSTGVSWTATRR